jgi:hypothetical protein
MSDLERRFVCSACGKRGADVRADFSWNKKAYPGDGLSLGARLCIQLSAKILRTRRSGAGIEPLGALKSSLLERLVPSWCWLDWCPTKTAATGVPMSVVPPVVPVLPSDGYAEPMPLLLLGPILHWFPTMDSSARWAFKWQCHRG